MNANNVAFLREDLSVPLLMSRIPPFQKTPWGASSATVGKKRPGKSVVSSTPLSSAEGCTEPIVLSGSGGTEEEC